MAEITCDVCIIGAGSGGLSVAAGAAQMGADTVLIEGHKMGGDCLNYGCVPSKALLAAAKNAHALGTGGPFGVAPVAPQVDYAAAKDHVARAIAAIEPHDSQERFEGLGVRVLRDWARFISPAEVEAGEHRVRARRYVVATGSVPLVPAIPGLADTPHLTNETLWDLRTLPEHLIIIGGGPIGLEMAQAHARLGSRVTVLEAGRAMARDDAEMVATLLEAVRADGVDLREQTAATAVRAENGGVVVETPDGAINGSHLLVAVGRRVVTEHLGLEAAGIETTARGIKVDASLRTTNRRVYAIGDAAGGLQFTHLAGYHAGVVVRSILFGLPAKARTDHIPWTTYTDPELAQIGLTEAEARARHGDKLEIARAPFAGNDRAIAEGRTVGETKVMVVAGRPVGVSILGPGAGDLIGLWALVIANNLKMKSITNMVAPYPTLGEIGKRAAGAYFSPRLFENPTVKRIVRTVQRWVP